MTEPLLRERLFFVEIPSKNRLQLRIPEGDRHGEEKG